MRKILGRLSVIPLFMACVSGPALAQSGRLETQSMPRLGLPQTTWIKAEVLGDSAAEQSARAKVDELLRLRGYVPEAFSPYAVRIEIRGGGVQPHQVAIPQYNNPVQRLSLWNAASTEGVTVSLTLYHQSSGRVSWQAEATCPNLDASAVPGSMIVPLMEHFGRSITTSLSCTR